MPSLPLRIAVLECDTPLPGTVAKYGGYGGAFTSLLHSATSVLSPPLSTSDLQISKYDVVTAQAYPDLDDIDAILISGSKYNSFDSDPWILKLVDFCKETLAEGRVRIIGVCFGHQILGRALGCEVGRSEKGWEISVMPLELTPKGQAVFGVPSLAIHQMHRDIVVSLPPEVDNLAYTSKCAIHAFYAPKRFIAVQGHPEFTEAIMREIVEARHTSGVLNDEIYVDSLTRVANKQDGVLVAAAFLRLLLEE